MSYPVIGMTHRPMIHSRMVHLGMGMMLTIRPAMLVMTNMLQCLLFGWWLFRVMMCGSHGYVLFSRHRMMAVMVVHLNLFFHQVKPTDL